MFQVKLEVNHRVIKEIIAVRQSDRAYGDNSYAVYLAPLSKFRGENWQIADLRNMGYITHVFEDGAEVLAQKMIEFTAKEK